MDSINSFIFGNHIIYLSNLIAKTRTNSHNLKKRVFATVPIQGRVLSTPCMPLRVLHLLPLLNAESNFATTSTLQVVVSRAWSRRAIAHAQPKIPAQDVHGTTRGKRKSTESGSSILMAGSCRYALIFCVLSECYLQE